MGFPASIHKAYANSSKSSLNLSTQCKRTSCLSYEAILVIFSRQSSAASIALSIVSASAKATEVTVSPVYLSSTFKFALGCKGSLAK